MPLVISFFITYTYTYNNTISVVSILRNHYAEKAALIKRGVVEEGEERVRGEWQ